MQLEHSSVLYVKGLQRILSRIRIPAKTRVGIREEGTTIEHEQILNTPDLKQTQICTLPSCIFMTSHDTEEPKLTDFSYVWTISLSWGKLTWKTGISQSQLNKPTINLSIICHDIKKPSWLGSLFRGKGYRLTRSKCFPTIGKRSENILHAH